MFIPETMSVGTRIGALRRVSTLDNGRFRTLRVVPSTYYFIKAVMVLQSNRRDYRVSRVFYDVTVDRYSQ